MGGMTFRDETTVSALRQTNKTDSYKERNPTFTGAPRTKSSVPVTQELLLSAKLHLWVPGEAKQTLSFSTRAVCTMFKFTRAPQEDRDTLFPTQAQGLKWIR